MTDFAMPPRDRNEPAPYRPGPAMARAALTRNGPMTEAEFAREVVATAVELGWQVHRLSAPISSPSAADGLPTGTWLMCRDEQVLVVHARMAPPSWAQQEWVRRLCRADGVDQVVFLSREGLGPVADRLGWRDGPDRPPLGETDDGRRAD